MPGGVVDAVVTVIVEEPDVSDAGLKPKDAPLGKPLALSATAPLNPPVGVTVAV